MTDVRHRLVGLLDYVEQVARLDQRAAFSLRDYRLPDGATFAVANTELLNAPGVTLDSSDADGAVWLEVARPSTKGKSGKDSSRKPTHALYQALNNLFQKMEAGDSSIELVWGMGLVRWQKNGRTIDRPLLERRMEIERDEATGALRLRPTNANATFDLRPYEELGCPKLTTLATLIRREIQRAAKKDGLSPFLRESTAPILTAAATRLDPRGTFEPDTTSPPLAPHDSGHLVITGEAVLFARTRSKQAALQDIEALRDAALDEGQPIEGLAKQLVAAPSYQTEPAFHAALATPLAPPASPIDWGETNDNDGSSDDDDDDWDEEEFMRSAAPTQAAAQPAAVSVDVPDVFFPKPSNDAQIEICRALARSDGLVVQGPPGTGKTHTIANLVSHAMATGQRVLVVSHKDAALAGLREQLPAEIRPLAIALLSSEREGLRQLEATIREVQSDDEGTLPGKRRAAIARLELQLSQYKDRIATIDRELEAIAAANVARIGPRNETPVELAQRIAAEQETYEWFTDRPLHFSSDAGFGDDDLAALAAARAKAGELLDHNGARLPSTADLPDTDKVVSWHNALIAASRNDEEAARGPAPSLRVTQDSIADAELLARSLDDLAWTQQIVAQEPWIARFRDGLLTDARDAAVMTLQEIVSALDAIERRRATLRGRAIELPTSLADDREREMTVRWAGVLKEIGVAHDGREQETLALGRKLVHAREKIPNLRKLLAAITGDSVKFEDLAKDGALCDALARQLRIAIGTIGLASVDQDRRRLKDLFEDDGRMSVLTRQFIGEAIGNPAIPEGRIKLLWSGVLQRLDQIKALSAEFEIIATVTGAIAAAGAPDWAKKLSTEKAGDDDKALPQDWRAAWDHAAALAALARIDVQGTITRLSRERTEAEREQQDLFGAIIRERTFYEIGLKLSPETKAALVASVRALERTERGGKLAAAHRRKAREAMAKCHDAVACWIMPTWRVAEQIPAAFGQFDLVIMDEASQSDISELPVLLRAKKVLVIGDDQQIGPRAPFVTQEQIARLRDRTLGELPASFKRHLEPGESLLGLMQAVFPAAPVTLKEHFRSVEPIIRFSTQFYSDALVPLRIPTARDRLDPPLIDIYVPHGVQTGRINEAEADVIVGDIKTVMAQPEMARRSIGVISLMGEAQADLIRSKLTDAIGADAMRSHAILCGDSAAFQGHQRDIVYLSMVTGAAHQSTLTMPHHAQRFNVAVSSATDRLVLVRSVQADQLDPSDLRARLIAHFENPMPDAVMATDALTACETDFERELMEELLKRGYRAQSQAGPDGYRIDLVVEGANGARLAIACDGDRANERTDHNSWQDEMRRQRALERAGWTFWRGFALGFARNADAVMADLIETLSRMGIEPARAGDAAPKHGALTEHRTADAEISTSGISIAPDMDDLAAKRDRASPATAGIDIGDKIVLQFSADQKRISVRLTEDSNDLVAGRLSVRSPLGRAVLGTEEGDEIELDETDDAGRPRRVLIESVDKSEPHVAETALEAASA